MGTWQHMRRRLQIQGALVQETNFRRAMENSMLTGMRAMDKDGRITYVNPAFCAMTGFSEAELIGRMPPYPHWPPERHGGKPSAAAAGAGRPQPGRRLRGARAAQGRHAVRRAHVRLAADRLARPADRLDDLDDQHHRGQAHPRPAHRLARALHDRAGGAGRGGVGGCRRRPASCCSPTVPTGSGFGRRRALARRARPASAPATSTSTATRSTR